MASFAEVGWISSRVSGGQRWIIEQLKFVSIMMMSETLKCWAGAVKETVHEVGGTSAIWMRNNILCEARSSLKYGL